MKRVILLIFSLFSGIFSAFAQMMPDSTVQVVAYWQLGDKYHYEVEDVKYRIVQEDTTVVDKSAEIVEFEIVAADDEKGYRVKATTLESQYIDPIMEISREKWEEQFGRETFYFETDPYGQFLRVLPIEGLEEKEGVLIQTIVDAVLQKSDGLSRDQVLTIVRTMISQETLMKATALEYAPLFAFHGTRLDIREEYPIEDEAPSLFGDGKAIRMTGSFWVDEELTDDYSVVLRLYKRAGEEQMVPFISALINQIVQPLMTDTDDEESVRKAIDEAYENARMSMEDYLFEEVHLDTGWPIQFCFDREILVKIGDQEVRQLNRKTVRMILED